MRTDLRLVAPAALCWLTAALLVRAPSAVAVGVAVTAIVLAGGLAGGRRSPDDGHPSPPPARHPRLSLPPPMARHPRLSLSLPMARHPRLVSHVVLAALCVGAVAGSCAWRVAQVESSPLSALAERRAIVEAEAQVVLDAREFSRFGATSSVAGLRIDRVTAEGRTIAMGDRVTAFLDGPAEGLVIGRRLVLTARLSPSDDPRESAVLNVIERGEVIEAATWWEGSERLRQAIREAVAHRPPEEAALVPALVAGDDAALPEQVEDDFRRTGLTHLLAVSGTNLTIVLAVVLALARAARASPRVLLVVGLLGVVGFVLLARPEPSVLRAAAMGVVGLAALGYGGRGGLRALAVAVVVLLFIDPWLSTAVGFTLSVCATAGILVAAPPLTERLSSWMPRWAALSIAVPLAAQLAVTPTIAAFSGEVSLVAVAANLAAGPVVAPATVAGLFAGLATLVWPLAGRVLGFVAGLCAGWIVRVARWASGLDGAAVAWDAPWWLLLPIVPVVAWAFWRWAHRPVVVVGLALGLGVALWRPPSPGWPPEGWVAAACDVGQGDATVLRTDDDSAVVVDVGADSAAVDRCLRGLGVRQLHGVVLTHDHADHVGGFDGAVRGRGSPPVLVGTSGEAPPGYAGRTVAAGDVLEVGPWRLAVLWPPPGERVESAEPEGAAANDASVTMRATAHGMTMLLTGDLEPEGQEALLGTGVDVAADVLKMPHHGSGRQSERFFEAVAPRIATISVGADNDYGHPAADALKLLDDVGARWWRTDRDGHVALVVRDGRLSVATR